MKRINVVSASDSQSLRRQEPSVKAAVEWIYTANPVNADFHVIRGLTEALRIPNVPQRTLFVVGEPPEVRQFDVDSLQSYGRVLSGRFPYLASLSNVRTVGGLLPWRLGLSFTPDSDPKVFASRSDFSNLPLPPLGNKITAVVSSKANTAMQVARLRTLDYLSKKMPELEIYGRGIDDVEDTLEVFSRASFHIAIENSLHEHYWTEKLSDPLLALNHVIYGGHPANLVGFPPEIALHVNPFRPRETYRMVSDWVSSVDPESTEHFRRTARDALLHRENLHQRVLDEIGSISATLDLATHTGSEFLVPAHRKFGAKQSISHQFLKRAMARW